MYVIKSNIHHMRRDFLMIFDTEIHKTYKINIKNREIQARNQISRFLFIKHIQFYLFLHYYSLDNH